MPKPSSSSSSTPTPPSSGSAERLDLRGEVCPYTFVRTRLRLEALPLGTELRVLLDHEPATRNIPRSARDWGQEVRSVDQLEEALWEVALVKRVE